MSSEFQQPIYSIPLFPLHFVLFPQFPLQIHVFEDRYRAMISECIERERPFGVVLISKGEETGEPAVPCNIGCSARILAVRKMEDGRMNLLAVGESRFRLLEYSEAELPYLVGRVQNFDDGDWSDAEPEKPLRDLHRLFRIYLDLLAECSGTALPKLTLPNEPTALGFCIAAVTELATEEKQELLELTDPRARLKSEKRLLRRQIKELEIRRSASEPVEPIEPRLSHIVTAHRLDPKQGEWQTYINNARN